MCGVCRPQAAAIQRFEHAVWPTDDSANPNTEVLNAIRPGMATVEGAMLLCISSPYARGGESTSSSAFETWRIVACDVESVRGASRAIDPGFIGSTAGEEARDSTPEGVTGSEVGQGCAREPRR